MSSQAAIRSVWMLSREYEGIAGAGGVKDMVRQAAEACARAGCCTTVVLPAYGFADTSSFTPLDLAFEVDMSYTGQERREKVEVLARTQHQVRIFLLASPRFAEKRAVYTYTADDERENPFQRRGTGHYDYFAMNVLLQKGALALMASLGERPEVIHCHDGHTALAPVLARELEGYRHFFQRTGCVVTIHNAGLGYHQEVDDLPFAQAITGLGPRVIHGNLLGHAFDPLLAAGGYAALSTVSEAYARELQETDLDSMTGWLGHRLLARGVRITGITNGINPSDYDPGQPERYGLPAAFDPASGDLAGKKVCRRWLLDRLANTAGPPVSVRQIGGLARMEDGHPLFTMVGRLTSQKGVDKLIGALESLLPLDPGFGVLILGSGEKTIENCLARLAGDPESRGRLCLLLGYDERLATAVFAAGDFFLVPSRYEPCGLTDFIAQLFANLPVVHHTGGLTKVENGVTGFAYREHSSAALMGTMQRAISTFRRQPGVIRRMQRAAVERIHERYTWDQVIQRYFDLYRAALPQ